MQFNYYFLKHLSQELAERLTNASIVECFSQNKNEIIFVFVRENLKEYFVVKALLDGQTSLLSFTESFARARKNSVDLFSDLIKSRVKRIVQFENERSFVIHFQNNLSLLFKLHGRQANILLFKKEMFLSMFKKNLLKDQNINLKQLHRPLNQNISTINTENLKNHFPTFDKTIQAKLEQLDFTHSPKKALRNVLKELNSGVFYLTETENKLPKLTLIKPQNDRPFETFKSAVDISNTFARQLLTDFHFNQEQRKQITRLITQIKKAEKYIEVSTVKLHDIETKIKHNQTADLLMANLHVPVNKGMKQISLFDFYLNEDRTIKINPNIPLQKNAENYYRKAKNQKLETAKIKENIEAKKNQVERLKEKINEVQQSTDYRALKKLSPPQKESTSSQESKPYFHQVVDGYDVYIGKNAKNNDILTLKIATKNDLWLHAKDVPGSHVVIKSKGNDQYPKDLIEKVAQMAAWHSKRKHDTLCPVIYTLKKYVNKPKGALPGSVRLLREEVILVPPKKS